MIILDTNVLSEVMKPTPSEVVMDWLARQDPSAIYTTTVTQAEVLCGIEAMPPGKRRAAVSLAADRIFGAEFRGRLLAFDEDAARMFAHLVARRTARGRLMSQPDAMIAAICGSRRAALATRNFRDFENRGLTIIDPWKA